LSVDIGIMCALPPILMIKIDKTVKQQKPYRLDAVEFASGHQSHQSKLISTAADVSMYFEQMFDRSAQRNHQRAAESVIFEPVSEDLFICEEFSDPFESHLFTIASYLCMFRPFAHGIVEEVKSRSIWLSFRGSCRCARICQTNLSNSGVCDFFCERQLVRVLLAIHKQIFLHREMCRLRGCEHNKTWAVPDNSFGRINAVPENQKLEEFDGVMDTGVRYVLQNAIICLVEIFGKCLQYSPHGGLVHACGELFQLTINPPEPDNRSPLQPERRRSHRAYISYGIDCSRPRVCSFSNVTTRSGVLMWRRSDPSQEITSVFRLVECVENHTPPSAVAAGQERISYRAPSNESLSDAQSSRFQECRVATNGHEPAATSMGLSQALTREFSLLSAKCRVLWTNSSMTVICQLDCRDYFQACDRKVLWCMPPRLLQHIRATCHSCESPTASISKQRIFCSCANASLCSPSLMTASPEAIVPRWITTQSSSLASRLMRLVVERNRVRTTDPDLLQVVYIVEDEVW
ncbi:hypothetical protein KCU62_g499, partial [Aureobasidium sp. EXF-3399]